MSMKKGQRSSKPGPVKNDTLTERWINRLRNTKFIAFFTIAALFIGGITSGIGYIQTFFDWYYQRLAVPIVTAFTLSPSARGYEESRDILFGSSMDRYRTFGPVYPPEDITTSIFLITISNPRKSDMIITEVIYDIKAVGGVRGGPPGPMIPLAKYHHTIRHETGQQNKTLIPPFRIPGSSAASFEIELSSPEEEPGLGWLMRIGFISDIGTAYTDEFQLYLPAKDSSLLSDSQELSDTEQNFQDPTGDLLTQSVSVELKPTYISCVFRRLNIEPLIMNLDALDHHMMFLRAGLLTPEGFANKHTETTPPIRYGNLLSEKNIRLLLTTVKSRVACSEGLLGEQ